MQLNADPLGGRTKSRVLDSLLGSEEVNATFHDALLLRVEVDYARGTLSAEFSICVGDPNSSDVLSRERRRNGRLSVSGLLHWSIEPGTERLSPNEPLWLTSDGPLREAPTDAGRTIGTAIGGDHHAWYLYFSDLNAFAYCVGVGASFEWLPVAAA